MMQQLLLLLGFITTISCYAQNADSLYVAAFNKIEAESYICYSYAEITKKETRDFSQLLGYPTLTFSRDSLGELYFTNLNPIGAYSTGQVFEPKVWEEYPDGEGGFLKKHRKFYWNYYNTYDEVVGNAAVYFVTTRNMNNEEVHLEAWIDVIHNKKHAAYKHKAYQLYFRGHKRQGLEEQWAKKRRL
jgi:hypothetical protein